MSWTARKINERDWCVESDDNTKPLHITVEKAFGETDADVETRARLIAAAPKMADALKLIARSDTFRGGSWLGEVQEIARTAIKIVEGKI